MRKLSSVLFTVLVLVALTCRGQDDGGDDDGDDNGGNNWDDDTTAAPMVTQPPTPLPVRKTKVHTHSYDNTKIKTTVTHFPAVKKDSQWAGTMQDILVLLTKDGLVYYSRTNAKTWAMIDGLANVIVDRIDCIKNTSRMMMYSNSKALGIHTYLFDFDAGTFSTVRASFGREQTVFSWLTLDKGSNQVASKGLTFDSISVNPIHTGLALARTIDPSCKRYPSRKDCHMILWVTGFHGLESYKTWRPITTFDDFWYSAEWSTGRHHHNDLHEIFAVRRPNMATLTGTRLVKLNTNFNQSKLFVAPSSTKHSFTLLHGCIMVKREGDYMFALTLDASLVKSKTKIAFTLHVSKNDFWTSNAAKFPNVHADGSKITGTHLGYDVVDVQDEIFVNVYNNFVQGGLFSRRWGTTYVSGMNGHRYTLSLEYNRRHINLGKNVQSATDWHRVGALEGVIIANVLLNADNLKCVNCPTQTQCDSECSFGTVLSRDNGKTWQPMDAPAGYCQDEDGGTAGCNLHLHGATSADGDLAVDIKPLMSSRTAPGLIIGSGNVGSELNKEARSLFMSRDGGETWATLSTGRHLYGEANYGSMVYLIKHATASGLLNYTTDSGKNWHTTHFLKKKVASSYKWSDLIEPTHQPTRKGFTMFGLDTDEHLVAAHVEFKSALMSACTPSCTVSREKCPNTVTTFVNDASSQFEYFTPASYVTEDATQKCLMGRVVKYARLKQGKSCWQGPNTVVQSALSPNTKKVYQGLAAPASTHPCQCGYDDYECDYFYYEPKKADGSEGLTCKSYFRHPEKIYKIACIWGRGWYMSSNGYRKIGGDGCQGGKDSELDPRNLTCAKPSSPSQPPTELDKSWSGFAKFMVFCVVVALLVGGGYLLYKQNDTARGIMDQLVVAAVSVMPRGGINSQYRTVATNEDGGGGDSDNDGNNSGDDDGEQLRTARRQAADTTSAPAFIVSGVAGGTTAVPTVVTGTTVDPSATASASANVIQAATVESPRTGSNGPPQASRGGPAPDLIDIFE